MSRRKEPRLNIRFPDFDVIDILERRAHQRGLKLYDYVRQMIIDIALAPEFSNIVRREIVRGDLETRKLIQMLAGEDATAKAKAHVRDYFSKVEDHELRV